MVLLALAAAGAGVALAQWQSGRAHQKRAEAKALQHVRIEGEFLPQHTVLLDNKLRHGRPGYEVVMPLKPAGGGRPVLVNRGWVAAPPTRDVLPPVRTPSGKATVEGVARTRFPRILEVQPQRGQAVRQTLDIADFAVETGLALEPYYLEQHSAAADGLNREWVAPDAGVEKHESYALQWYSLAVLALVLGIVFSFRRVAAR